MKRVLIPGVILCGADVAQAVDDKNMYMHFFEEMTVYAPVPVPVNGNTITPVKASSVYRPGMAISAIC